MDPLADRKNKLAIKIMVMPNGDDDDNKEKELGEEGMPPALPSVDKQASPLNGDAMNSDPDADQDAMDASKGSNDPGMDHPDKEQDLALIKEVLGSMSGRPGGLKDLVAKQAMKKSLNKNTLK